MDDEPADAQPEEAGGLPAEREVDAQALLRASKHAIAAVRRHAAHLLENEHVFDRAAGELGEEEQSSD